MPDTPLKIRILHTLRCALEQDVVKGDCYFNTLQGKVFVGRAVFDENDPLPMISILEVPVPADQKKRSSGSTTSAGPWELVVQGFIREPDRAARFLTQPAYELMQDVYTRLNEEAAKPDSRVCPELIFGFREIASMVVSDGVVRPDEERSGVCFFWLPLTFNLARV